MEVAKSISPEQLVALLRELAGRMNKDKNVICLGLSSINTHVHGWYNAISDAYSSIIARCITKEGFDTKTITEEVKFQNSRHNSPAVKQSIEFLNDVEYRYNHNELRKLVSKLDMKKISEIRRLIQEFDKVVFEVRVFPIEELGDRSQLNAEKAKLIQNWICNLDGIREKIRIAVISLQNELECDAKHVYRLEKQLIK